MNKSLSYYQAKAIDHLNNHFDTERIRGASVHESMLGQGFSKSCLEFETKIQKSRNLRRLADRIDAVKSAIGRSVTKSEVFKIMKENKELFKSKNGGDLPFTLELVKEVFPGDPQRNSFKKIKKIAVKKSVLASMFQDQEREVNKSCLDSEYQNHEPKERFSETVKNILSGK